MYKLQTRHWRKCIVVIIFLAWIAAVASITIISLCGLVGIAMVPLTKFSAYHDILRFMISVAIGTLVGDALMVNAIWRYVYNAFDRVSIDYSIDFFFFFFQKMMLSIHKEHHSTPSHAIQYFNYLLLVSFMLLSLSLAFDSTRISTAQSLEIACEWRSSSWRPCSW